MSLRASRLDPADAFPHLRERERAILAETELTALSEIHVKVGIKAVEYLRRAEQAEAATERVRALAARWVLPGQIAMPDARRDLLEALDQPGQNNVRGGLDR